MAKRVRSVSKEIENEVKRANQRLRQLEKDKLANVSKAYQYITNKALKNLASDTKVKRFARTRSGQIKFRTDLATLKKENINVYKTLIKNVEGFLNAKTSTRIGIEDTYRSSYEGFKDTTGYSGSFSDFSNLFSNSAYEYLLKYFSVSELGTMLDYLDGMYPNMSESEILDEMISSGKTTVQGMYEYFREKYNINDEDYEEV